MMTSYFVKNWQDWWYHNAGVIGKCSQSTKLQVSRHSLLLCIRHHHYSKQCANANSFGFSLSYHMWSHQTFSLRRNTPWAFNINRLYFHVSVSMIMHVRREAFPVPHVFSRTPMFKHESALHVTVITCTCVYQGRKADAFLPRAFTCASFLPFIKKN